MRICVFSGSSVGRRDDYGEAAARLGNALVDQGIGLVYGGGGIGLMGRLAATVRARGGEVIGVMPRALFERELGEQPPSELRIVGSMHERKAMMADLSDAFIALPGGIGTMEELFEVWTWTQLGFQKKPCGLLNVAGFYDQFWAFIGTMTKEGFLTTENQDILMSDTDPAALIRRLKARI